MIFKVAESETEQQYRENKKKSTTFSPIPSPAAFWSKYKLQSENLLSQNYQQTETETYFADKSSKIYKYRSVLDDSLDISIAARSRSSFASLRPSSYCWSLLSSLLLLSSWRLWQFLWLERKFHSEEISSLNLARTFQKKVVIWLSGNCLVLLHHVNNLYIFNTK